MTKKTLDTPIVEKIVEVPKPIIPEKTTAEKIWDDIKNKHIDMFGLENQTPEIYCKPVYVDPAKLYVSYKVGALLPALELAFHKKYNVELVDRYITLSLKK